MRKNVLIFGHNYGSPFVDVSNQYTQLFDRNKYNVTVIYLLGKPTDEIKNQHLASNVVFLNFSKKSIRGLKIQAIKKMLRFHREKKFEIVICHRYKPLYIMLWVSVFKKIPVLIGVMHELDTLKNKARKFLIALLARKKNILFAGVSNAVRDNMRRDIWKMDKERVITLYNMIDVNLIEPQLLSREEAKKKLNLPQNAILLGNLGRLVINKDQKTLINAFAAVKKHRPETKLVIMGTGNLETTLKNQANDLGLMNDVIFTGFVPQGFRFLKAFDLFILSSTQEAFGRVLLETMTAKVTIIATRTDGIPEVIGDAGFLVDAASPDKLATTILQALKSNREEYINKAYDRVTSEFSIDKFRKIFWEHANSIESLEFHNDTGV